MRCAGLVDHVGLIDAGRLIAVGSPRDVLTDENLARAFRVRSETLFGADGTPFLLFHRLSPHSGRSLEQYTGDAGTRLVREGLHNVHKSDQRNASLYSLIFVRMAQSFVQADSLTGRILDPQGTLSPTQR